jgi:Tfp pilus assembly PilM family ATPase
MASMTRNRLRDTLVQLALQPRRLARRIAVGMPGSASQRLTLLALDGQWLKVLHTEGPPRARTITKLLVCPVQGAGAEEVRQRLAQACQTEELVPTDVLAANPTHLCTIRIFSLPSTDHKEIRDIVTLQAEKHTPYARDEILTDFKVIERERTGYSRVMLVIAHQDVVHRPIRLVESSGWVLDRLGCEMEGLVSWFLQLKKAAGGKPSAGLSMVVDVDGSTTTLVVIQRGQPLFQRSLATGLEQLEADPAGAGDRLLSELQRSIEALETESTAKLQEVVVTGPIERLEDLKGRLERGLDLPVSLVSPWQGWELSDGARATLPRLPDVSFAGLLGLTADAGTVDLTPPATKLRQAFEARAKTLVLLGCQFVGALILLSLLFIGRAQKEERYYAALRKVHAESAAQAGTVEASLQHLVFIEDRLRRQGQLLHAVDTLALLSPEDITWRTLAFTQSEAIVLSGTAEALPRVYEFSGAVTNSDMFGEAEPRRVTKRTEGERDVTDFELRCPLEAGGRGS